MTFDSFYLPPCVEQRKPIKCFTTTQDRNTLTDRYTLLSSRRAFWSIVEHGVNIGLDCSQLYWCHLFGCHLYALVSVHLSHSCHDGRLIGFLAYSSFALVSVSAASCTNLNITNYDNTYLLQGRVHEQILYRSRVCIHSIQLQGHPGSRRDSRISAVIFIDNICSCCATKKNH